MIHLLGAGAALLGRWESAVAVQSRLRLHDGPSWRPSTSPDAWRHHPSHTGFLRPVPPAAHRRHASIDLAVIPTLRPDPAARHGVRTAVGLAREGCLRRLLIVCSKDAATSGALKDLTRLLQRGVPSDVAVAVTVLGLGSGAVPSFAVDRLPITSAFRRYGRGNVTSLRSANEVGLKRNLGLMVAARLRLGHVLFLDDDVRPAPAEPATDRFGPTLDAASLSAAVAALHEGGLSAVGWALRGYDDNSVVCRASRLAGHEQDQFIGGGALAIRSPRQAPFFPAIYNEDWLFLLGLLDASRPPPAVLGCGGVVLQDPYDGYKPRRARSEELGDILGEGLMAILHGGRNAIDDVPDAAYWRSVIEGRQRMIEGVRSELAARPTGALEQRALAALDAALTVHTVIGQRRGFWLDQFVRYVRAWRADLSRWQACLDRDAADNSDLLSPAVTSLQGLDVRAAFGLDPAPSSQLLGLRLDDAGTPACGLVRSG